MCQYLNCPVQEDNVPTGGRPWQIQIPLGWQC
jgi:hypothetical protein